MDVVQVLVSRVAAPADDFVWSAPLGVLTDNGTQLKTYAVSPLNLGETYEVCYLLATDRDNQVCASFRVGAIEGETVFRRVN